jgi:hypothetical protein
MARIVGKLCARGKRNSRTPERNSDVLITAMGPTMCEASGDWHRDEGGDSVDGERKGGVSGRDAEGAREVEHEEGQHHRAGAVHESGGGEQPDFAGEIFEAAPGIHGVGLYVLV